MKALNACPSTQLRAGSAARCTVPRRANGLVVRVRCCLLGAVSVTACFLGCSSLYWLDGVIRARPLVSAARPAVGHAYAVSLIFILVQVWQAVPIVQPSCQQGPQLYSCCLLHRQASTNMCPYNTLGVDANASDHEVKQAYRKLVLQYHPDINHTTNAEAKFMSIQQAYELLTGKSRHSVQRPDGTRADSAFHDW